MSTPIDGTIGGKVTSPDGKLELVIPRGAFAGTRHISILVSPTRANPESGTGWIVHETWVIWADGDFATPLNSVATFKHAPPHLDLPARFYSHQDVTTPMPDFGALLPGGSWPPTGTTDYLPTRHSNGVDNAGTAPGGTTSFLSLMY